MATDATRPAPGAGGQFVGLFTPKLVTVLSEGYGLRQLRADALADKRSAAGQAALDRLLDRFTVETEGGIGS